MKNYSESRLSVVTPVYRNAETLEELCRQIFATTEGLFKEVEYIFVNDGSPDHSREVLAKLAKADPRVKVINFARNFGQHTALLSGLQHCRGDYAVFIDGDLEESPADLRLLFEKMKEGYEIAIGTRNAPAGSIARRLSRMLYTSLFNLMSEYQIIHDATTLRVMTRRYVEYLLQLPEPPFLPGFTAWIGLPVGLVPISWMKQDRKSSYSLKKLLSHGRRGILSFSNKPIRVMFWMGFALTSGAVIYGSYQIIRKLVWGDTLLGYPSMITILTLLMGVQYVFVGLLGEYIGEIFLAIKRRPSNLIYDKLNL